MIRGNKKIAALLGLMLAFGGLIEISCSKKETGNKTTPAKTIEYYTCSMHAFVHLDKPGKCPICSMDLVPVYLDKGSDQMTPNDALQGLAPVDLNAFQEKMIDVKVAKTTKQSITRLIRTVGRFGGGDFASLASDFTAQGRVSASGAPYVVADVYVLDQPFVKTGQRAWVSDFSGTGARIEGTVSRIFPNEGTQSRVRRVGIKLKSPMPGLNYANVEIETETSPRLSVPREAVLSTGIRFYLFVEEKPGKFIPREVEVGFQGDSMDEIIEGLKEGEQVAWGGTFMLDADAHIRAGAQK